MKQEIETLMADLFGIKTEDVTDSLTMANTDGWDSLKHMELIVSIEHTFGIELTFDEIVAMQTLKDIKKILKERAVG
ncbi:MAG: acyl carrier protein [Planctomycetota bacterium]